MKSKGIGTFRVGAVPFLNTKPLVRYLNLSEPPLIELKLEVPTLLTRMLEQNRLDVALLPSIEYFRGDKYRIIPGISISADGIVESVRIFSKVPIEEIRSVALDESSRTSVALSKILLKKRLGALPRFSTCTPDSVLSDIAADAMLLIGDAAMRFHSAEAVFVLDLGEEWKKITGLPFVYAMWVVRSGVETTGLHSKLLKARDEALAKLDEIAAEESRKIGLGMETCLHYLKNIMRYELGEREVEALKLFQRFAAEDELCPGDVEIVVA